MSIDRSRLRDLLASERAEYARRNPRSRELYDAGEHLFGRVPMTWMNKAAGGFPLGLDRADGARVWDLDGHEAWGEDQDMWPVHTFAARQRARRTTGGDP